MWCFSLAPYAVIAGVLQCSTRNFLPERWNVLPPQEGGERERERERVSPESGPQFPTLFQPQWCSFLSALWYRILIVTKSKSSSNFEALSKSTVLISSFLRLMLSVFSAVPREAWFPKPAPLMNLSQPRMQPVSPCGKQGFSVSSLHGLCVQVAGIRRSSQS